MAPQSAAADPNHHQFKLKSVRSCQPAHLVDTDLKMIIRNQRKLVYLDVCPCMLTNRSVLWINKYLNAHLKCLRLHNCCNWSQAVGLSGADDNMFELNEDEMIGEHDDGDAFQNQRNERRHNRNDDNLR